VDSTGLFDAAVATGAVAMPWKLPAPEDGTDEHAAPNGAAMADALGVADAAMDEDGDADADVADDELLVPLEPHAAAPSAMPTETVAMAADLNFTLNSLWLNDCG
jgi:hypothetical protein